MYIFIITSKIFSERNVLNVTSIYVMIERKPWIRNTR